MSSELAQVVGVLVQSQNHLHIAEIESLAPVTTGDFVYLVNGIARPADNLITAGERRHYAVARLLRDRLPRILKKVRQCIDARSHLLELPTAAPECPDGTILKFSHERASPL